MKNTTRTESTGPKSVEIAMSLLRQSGTATTATTPLSRLPLMLEADRTNIFGGNTSRTMNYSVLTVTDGKEAKQIIRFGTFRDAS